MGVMSAGDILGAEYDWLACDGDGHVALFSTAGGGYAPDKFLRDTDAHETAIRTILACQATTSALAPTLAAEHENTWKLAAERGLFAFDSDADGGPYRLVAAPEGAVDIGQLPEAAVDVIRSLTFPRLQSANMTVLPEQALRGGG